MFLKEETKKSCKASGQYANGGKESFILFAIYCVLNSTYPTYYFCN